MADRPSDSDLVAAALKGSQEAFGELVARYRDAIFGVAFHRLGDFEEARDAAQEILLKAFLNLATLRNRASFGHWLYRIADGTALDFARRGQRESSLPGEGGIPAAGVTAHERARQTEVARQVREALDTLPERTRLAVILHHAGGYSHAEVADFLGITTGAVKTRLSRARGRLRKEMIEMVGEKVKKESGVFRFVAKDGDGRVVECTAHADSEASLLRLLRQRGLSVLKIEADRSTPRQTEGDQRDPIGRIVQLIFQRALKEGATAIKIALAPLGKAVAVYYLVKTEWHHDMMVPKYVWAPVRERLAEMAGVHLREGSARQTGRIRFSFESKDHDFNVLFTPKTIRIDLLGGRPSGR